MVEVVRLAFVSCFEGLGELVHLPAYLPYMLTRLYLTCRGERTLNEVWQVSTWG